jgi:hypothetical protein
MPTAEPDFPQKPKRAVPTAYDNDDQASRTWEWNRVVHGLGLVCIEFQILETVLRAGIAELASKDDQVLGTLIAAELSFRNLIDLLYAIFEYEWEGCARPKELKSILQRCLVAEAKRNQLIHSSWYQPTTKRGVTRIKFTARNQRGLRVQHETVTPADMEKIAEELRTCRKELALYLVGSRRPTP